MGRRCCCGGPCVFAQDDFDRANAATAGSAWDEISGTWSIDSNTLKEAGTSGAKIRHKNASSSPGDMYARVYGVNPQIGDKYVLYVDGNTTFTTYHKVVFTVVSAVAWTVELYAVTTLLDSKTMTPLLLDPGYNMYACLADGTFIGSTGAAGDEYPWAEENAYGNHYAGLGNDGASAIYFNDFHAQNTVTGVKNCEACGCYCTDDTGQNVIQKTLTGTFTNCTGSAACLEGVTIDLEWTWGAGTPYWYAAGPVDLPGSEFKFWCSVGAPTGFLLENINDTCCSGVGNCDQYADADSVCEPLNLIFGPFYVRNSDLSCTICGVSFPNIVDGEYYIVVTEP